MKKLLILLGSWLLLLGSAGAKEVWVASNSIQDFSRQELVALVEGRTRQSFASGAATLVVYLENQEVTCLLYTSPSPRDRTRSRMPSSA